ncbi:MAG: ABC transporter ATP-binding protein, partial [Victivallaceae bacterium]
MSTIELHDLKLQVDKRILLNALNFSLSCGEKAVIYGRSGAGKSSLLRALSGFFPISGGEIMVDQVRLNRENIRIIRSKITFLTQESIPGAATALESIMLPYTFKANS